MRDLTELTQNEPVFTSGLLNVSGISAKQAKLQLVRWTNGGRIIQMRRGVYVLAKPYRKIEPHPFLLANYLKKASYVSYQSALAYYDLIPEHVPVVTSATTGRPESLTTPLGSFLFKHIKRDIFSSYRKVQVADRQEAIIATPEKALVDLLYMTPESDTDGYVEELRLQNMEHIDGSLLASLASQTKSRKVMKAVRKVLAGL